MTYQGKVTNFRDLDHENKLILAWTEFWKAFDRLTSSKDNLSIKELASIDSMRTDLEKVEDNGKWPPRGFLSDLKKAMS